MLIKNRKKKSETITHSPPNTHKREFLNKKKERKPERKRNNKDY